MKALKVILVSFVGMIAFFLGIAIVSEILSRKDRIESYNSEYDDCYY